MSEQVVPKTWDVSTGGALSEEAVRRLHSPAGRYRIQVQRLPPGTRYQGTMRPGRVYVLQGEGAYQFDSEVRLGRGQFADLPGGDFDFRVLGSEDYEQILVWELPPGFVAPLVQGD